MAKSAKTKRPVAPSAARAAVAEPAPAVLLVVGAIAGLFAYLVVSNGFFVAARPLLIGVLPGLVAGMLIAEPILAAIAAANSIAFGFLLSPPAAVQATDGRAWLLGVGLGSLVIAALVAAVVALLRKAGARQWMLAVAGLVLVAGSMWYGALTIAGSATLSGDAALVTALDAPVEPYKEMTDPEVYLFVKQRMDAGASYNAAWGEIISALGDRYEQSAPVKYRLPTLQWFWGLLPSSSWSLVIAALAFGTIALLSAYWFASRLTSPALGLVAAAAVATLYLRIASGPYLLQYESWAAALNLVALAVGLESLRRREAGKGWLGLMGVAAGAALVAALTRELSTYFLLGALVASVATAEDRERRTWIPWAAALAILVVAYVAHLSSLSAGGYLQGGGFSLPQDYSSPPQGHFAATLSYGTWLLGGLPWLPWLAYALSLAASIALKGWLRWTTLWAIAVPTALFVFFSPITVSGNPAGYWGMLVTPLAFAIAPAVVLLLPPALRSLVQSPTGERLA